MEIPKRITFIDTREKKHAPPREKDSTPDDAIFKFPDQPDTVEIMVQVLHHGTFYPPRHWEDKGAQLQNLLNAVRVAEKYGVDKMARDAEGLFDDHIKLFDDIPWTEYDDFAVAIERLYREVIPDDDFDIAASGEMHSSGRRARHANSYMPALKRYVVKYAANNYDKLMCDGAFEYLFDTTYGGLHPFHKDVKKAMKRLEIRAKSKEKKIDENDKSDKSDESDDSYDSDESDWGDFFADERSITIWDRQDTSYLLGRKQVLEESKFLHEHAPKPKYKSFSNEVYVLPDHPYGVRAVAELIDQGPRYFGVPDDVEAAGFSIKYLAHALAAGEKYGVFGMRDTVNGVLGSIDYVASCRKPSTIANAVETVYALKQYGKDDSLLRELKDKFVEWAVARGEGWDENVESRVCKKVPAFKQDVLRAEGEKRRADEEGGKKDKDLDGGPGEGVGWEA